MCSRLCLVRRTPVAQLYRQVEARDALFIWGLPSKRSDVGTRALPLENKTAATGVVEKNHYDIYSNHLRISSEYDVMIYFVLEVREDRGVGIVAGRLSVNLYVYI